MEEKTADDMEKTEVSVISITEKEGENADMEKRKYGIDDLFGSLELKEFDVVVFAPRKEEHVVNGKRQTVTVGTNLKEKVRAALPSTEPDFLKDLINEGARKNYNLMYSKDKLTYSKADLNGDIDCYEKSVVLGLLTTIAGEEFSKKNPDEYSGGRWNFKYFKVPSGLNFVGIAAEGTPNNTVKIESDEFGVLCGADSFHLSLKGKKAGYGVLQKSVDSACNLELVGEGACEGAHGPRIYVEKNVGSGFMRNTVGGFGYVGGDADSGAGGGSNNITLHVNGNCGGLLLEEAQNSISATVGGNIGPYACFKAKKVELEIGGTAENFLAQGATDVKILVKALYARQEPSKLIGPGTGRIFVRDETSLAYVKNNKNGFEVMPAGNFNAGYLFEQK